MLVSTTDQDQATIICEFPNEMVNEILQLKLTISKFMNVILK